MQSPESVVLHPGDLVASEVKYAKVLQAAEHVGGDQVDQVAVEGQFQQLELTEKGPGLHGRYAVILKVEIMEAAQPGQVLQPDLHDRIVLQENSLRERGKTSCQKDAGGERIKAFGLLVEESECCVMFTQEKNEPYMNIGDIFICTLSRGLCCMCLTQAGEN